MLAKTTMETAVEKGADDGLLLTALPMIDVYLVGVPLLLVLDPPAVAARRAVG